MLRDRIDILITIRKSPTSPRTTIPAIFTRSSRPLIMFVSAIAFTLTTLSLVSATLNPTYCYQDNCYRGVLRTDKGQAFYDNAIADCKINLWCSATPSASIVTETTTTITGVTTITLAKITQQPTETQGKTTCGTFTPGYASLCSGMVRYSSACSCGSVTATTQTAATPTKTATVIYTQAAETVYV